MARDVLKATSMQRLLRACLVAAVLVGGSTLVSTASAQTVTLSTMFPDRGFPKRNDSLNPYWISYADCANGDGDTFTFHVSLSGFTGSGYTLQVYATGGGGTCTDATSRAGATATCSLIASLDPGSGVAQDVTVRVRDIVALHKESDTNSPHTGPGLGTREDCDLVAKNTGTDQPQPVDIFFIPISANMVGTGVIYSTKFDLAGPAAPVLTANAGDSLVTGDWVASVSPDTAGYYLFCDTQASPITMFDGGYDGGTVAAGGSAQCAAAGTSSSTAGTAGAAGTTSGTGGTAGTSSFVLAAGFAGAAGDGGAAGAAGDAGASGVGGVAGAAGTGGVTGASGTGGTGGDTGASGSGGTGGDTAGTAGSAGTAGATGVSGATSTAGTTSTSGSAGTTTCAVSACSTSHLVPNAINTDLAYQCGSFNGLATTHGQVTGQTNGVTYSVAVAAFDGVGNVGALSNVACATPDPINDFFQVYRDAGGQAGGGFCQASAVGYLSRGVPLLPWFALSGAVVARVLRRRRGKR